MSRKNIIIGVGAGIISILALANQASADTRRFDHPRYNRPAHQEIRGDRKELFKDRGELRRTSESSIGTRLSCVETYGVAPVERRLLETGPKSGRVFERFGRTVERFGKITENYDAILISMAGIGLPTIAGGTAMRRMVTAARIGGVGIATGGIATEKKSQSSPQLDQS